MRIFLTKKLAMAMDIKASSGDDLVNPLFCWTANWTNTFANRKEDMVVMVNHATQFTIAIYGVKHNQFKNIETKMIAAIKNTLLAINLNPELVDEYINQMGEVSYASNHDRKMTAKMNSRGFYASLVAADIVSQSTEKIKFIDTWGRIVSRQPVNYGNNSEEGFIPIEKMTEALAELTGKPAYKYRAFEVAVTLDLEIYKVTRRLIVPADISFERLHKVLQRAFGWENYHLFDFVVFENKTNKVCAILVQDEELLLDDDDAVMMDEHKLSDYFPKQKHILYTYDMGDSWEHAIELVNVIEEHNEQSPYLLEASGQTPPEDVGGVGGFIDFREIMLNPNHPEYAQTKEWARFWSLELSEWETRPRVI